jgi:hypothetical protein
MSTKRTPIARGAKAQITPEAVRAFRRLRHWEARCMCLPPPALPASSGVSVNGRWIHAAPGVQAQYQREQAGCAASRAACRACPRIAAAEARLLAALRIAPRPWQSGLEAFPEVEAALEAAARSRQS